MEEKTVFFVCLQLYKVVDILRDSRSALRPGISVLSTECVCVTCCGIMGKITEHLGGAGTHSLRFHAPVL